MVETKRGKVTQAELFRQLSGNRQLYSYGEGKYARIYGFNDVDGIKKGAMNDEINNMLEGFSRLGLPIPDRLQDALKNREMQEYQIYTNADRLALELGNLEKENISRITASDPSVGKIANGFMDDAR